MAALILLALTAMGAYAGCVAFGPAVDGSACSREDGRWRWLDPPASARQFRSPQGARYHPAISDPALGAGLEISGNQTFRFEARGEHILEIFLMNPEADRYSFRLEAAARLLDERPVIQAGLGRMRPKRGLRYTTLIARVTGPLELRLVTKAPRYVLSAARWTPSDQFERETVPRLLPLARKAVSTIMTSADGYNPMARRAIIQQLYDIIAFSRDPKLSEEALLGRTRAWFWLAAENHEPDDILQTHLLFEEGLRRMPGNPILRQMISASCIGQVAGRRDMARGGYCASVEPIPWSVPVPPAPANAPAWAVAQRALMRRMEQLTAWWVEKRQAPNGELGGGWGDDVEILRHWGPQALGFGSPSAARGVLRVASGVWNSGTLLNGYDRSISDVEHSSEPTTDTVPLAVALSPSDQELRARAAATAACSEYWLARQPDGFTRFRSAWFNCREADVSNGRDVDLHMNTRAMGPALWHAYVSRDPALIARIAAWADAWIHAMRQTAHGKPAGVFPPVMKSADGNYLVRSDRWDKPDAEWDYFQWDGGSQAAMTNLVLAAYELTGRREYLDAARESFLPARDCARDGDVCRAIRSSPDAFHNWRSITGNPEFDAAFGYSPGLSDAQILEAMTESGRLAEKKMACNWDILTSEVLYTDRVYYGLPAGYCRRLFGGEAPRGDRYPFFAVTWPASAVELARAVLESGPERLRIRLYGFHRAAQEIEIRLWRLKPGAYRWSLGGQSGRFTIAALPHTLRVALAPAQECTLLITGQPPAGAPTR